MKILMLETMTYGDDISLEQFNRLGEVVTYSLSSYEEAVVRMKEHNPDVVIINKTMIVITNVDNVIPFSFLILFFIIGILLFL